MTEHSLSSLPHRGITARRLLQEDTRGGEFGRFAVVAFQKLRKRWAHLLQLIDAVSTHAPRIGEGDRDRVLALQAVAQVPHDDRSHRIQPRLFGWSNLGV